MVVNINIGPGTCNENQQEEQNDENNRENNIVYTDSSKEMALHTLDLNIGATTSFQPVSTRPSSITFENEVKVITKPSKLSDNSSTNSRPITAQPIRMFSTLSSPVSVTLPSITQPQSLFVIALKKLNEDTLNAKILHYIQTYRNPQPNISMKASNIINMAKLRITESLLSELSAPDSLTNAPPSYSFVLRQMANRRRPRLTGTFIPSPSFVRQTPPPTYAAAFDIYIPIPAATQQRTVPFGFTAMPVVCPECGSHGVSVIKTKITVCTHLSAVLLCVFCCWICVPLPYIMRSCKDVYHYCRHCGHYLGMYCPTNPENPTYVYSSPTN